MNHQNLERIGFGGGCHWCTEAIFQSLKGVTKVEQGWIASTPSNDTYSEAVIVHFDENQIDLLTLVQIHLHTHSSTSKHTMRNKYRSAIYSFSNKQSPLLQEMIAILQVDFEELIITKILPFQSFKKNIARYKNYYYSNPQRAFCKTYIQPKLSLLQQNFSQHVNKIKEA